MYDIIPDIHGQAEKLKHRLACLGYGDTGGAWRHPTVTRTAVFLGDFIDRGPENAEVIDIVRRMVDAGSARAVMGNHELNAIRYHTEHPETGEPLRERSAKNTKQHRTFLEEYPVGASKTRNVIDWMRSLPLFLETEEFRAVHACWDESHVYEIKTSASDGILDGELHVEVADPRHLLHDAVETTTKGPEFPLPKGYGFHDKDGVKRDYIRAKWWSAKPRTWHDIAMSVPEPNELPPGEPPAGIVERSYPAHAKPVFFGHYWLTGHPVMQAKNALCLDYSAGKDGPLVSYLFIPGDKELQLERITTGDLSGRGAHGAQA
jgi:hypothetical protein